VSERGQILVANHEGTYLLRFVGDVRLTLCVAIDDFLQKMFDDDRFQAVVVDLSQARGLDSTSLGILAKLATETRKRTAGSPLLVCSNPDVLLALQSVGIDELFEPSAAAISQVSPLGALEDNEPDEALTRQRVLESHRLLMALNPQNEAKFKDLVTTLEALDESQSSPQSNLGGAS